MGRDDSLSTTVASVVPFYSCSDSSLLGSAQSDFPMLWFFPTARTTCPRELHSCPVSDHFQSLAETAQKWLNCTSDRKSDGRY